MLDESLAQPRPRWFGFVGSSGLEIGVIGDLLAACYDINLAIGTEAASHVERQALRWVGELVGYPGTGGACTSGGMLSNLTALAAARERVLPGSRTAASSGRRPRSTARRRRTTRSSAQPRCSDCGPTRCDRSPSTTPTHAPRGRRHRGRRGPGRRITPIACVASAGARSPAPSTRSVGSPPSAGRAARLAARRRGLRSSGRCGALDEDLFEALELPTPSRSMHTSGATCRRPVASSWCEMRARSSRRSRTTSRTCCTTRTSVTPSTPRSSTRGRFAPQAVAGVPDARRGVPRRDRTQPRAGPPPPLARRRAR